MNSLPQKSASRRLATILYHAAVVSGVLFCLIAVLGLFDSAIRIGSREYGLHVHHWALHFAVKEKPAFTFTHGVDPYLVHSFGGFGYSHWPLAGHPPAVVGHMSQFFVPIWFLTILWLIALTKPAAILLRRHPKNRGFEVTPHDHAPRSLKPDDTIATRHL